MRPADEVTDELLAETDRRYLEFTKLLLALATGAFSLLLTFEQQYVPPLARVPLAGAGFVVVIGFLCINWPVASVVSGC